MCIKYSRLIAFGKQSCVSFCWRNMLLKDYLSALSAVLISMAAYANAANILGVSTTMSPSHLLIHMSVLKALAERGHNITVFSALEPIIEHKNIKTIVVPLTPEEAKQFSDSMANMAKEKAGLITNIRHMFGSLSVMISKQFDIINDPRFTFIYDDKDTKFDLMIGSSFINTWQVGIAAKLKIPNIVLWSGAAMELTDDIIGNPRELSYVPIINLEVETPGKMTFTERFKNLFIGLFMRVFRILMEIQMNSYYKRTFGNYKDMPSYYEAKNNVSLVFLNCHSLSEGPVRPNVPGVIEIGGIQIKSEPDPLPSDINELLSNASADGAILFSLGSTLKGENINPKIAENIFNTLSSLKQKVIWKWENLEKTPGKSANILYKKWLPQDDILAHPNLKLFITHAGKGGMAEAQYHAVPMLALPVFAEQPENAAKIVKSGFGLQLNLLELKVPEFEAAIKELLENPKYKNNIKQFSQLYRDRPLTARDNAVFWTEYVLRHHGAAHIQSPLVHLGYFASHNLDLYLVILAVAIVNILILKCVVRFVWRKCCKKTKPTPKQKQN